LQIESKASSAARDGRLYKKKRSQILVEPYCMGERENVLKKTTLAIALSNSFSCVAFAQSAPDRTSTVQFLYEACQKPHDSSSFSFCLGFVGGTGFLMTLNGTALQKIPLPNTFARIYVGSVGICAGQGMSNPSVGAMVQAFVNWAAKHPEHWGDMSISGVLMSLASTWPC